jgi:hypothetical protein
MPRLKADGKPGGDSMRPKYQILVSMILLFTLADVNAMNNISEAIGPYKISFSLPDDVNVTLNPTTENKQSFYGDKYTNYNLNLIASHNPAYTAAISIMENEEENIIHLGGSILETMKRLGYTSVAPVYNEIDGSPGILVVGNQTTALPLIHEAVYILDNQTPVVIISTFPWDNVTSMMLKTLHIEMVE